MKIVQDNLEHNQSNHKFQIHSWKSLVIRESGTKKSKCTITMHY